MSYSKKKLRKLERFFKETWSRVFRSYLNQILFTWVLGQVRNIFVAIFICISSSLEDLQVL